MINDAFDTMAFLAGGSVVIIRNESRNAKRVGVEGGLWDETVWEGDAEKASNAGCQAEKEDVPVETGGFTEGELGALGDEGGDFLFVSIVAFGLGGREVGGEYHCDQTRREW